MASVKKRADRGTYEVRWRDDEGRQRKRTFAKKGDADRFRAEVEADKARGVLVNPSKIKLGEYAEQWAASRPHRPTTATRTASMIRNHIAGTRLGSRPLAAVRPSEVQAWATDRAKVLAPSTLRQAVGLLRSVYAAAVLDRLVPTSPVVRITLPRHERARVVPPTVEQVRWLAHAMPPRYRAMVIVQAALGIRAGELMALRISDIDWLRRSVRIERQYVEGATEPSEPKTPRSRRTIPAPQVVLDALAVHLAEFPEGDDGLIFTTRGGRRLGHTYYCHDLVGDAVRAAGLPEGTTSHDLRHHFASVLLDAGESVVAVAERLGHEDASLVLSTYGHLLTNNEDRTRRAIDTAWSCAPGVPQAVQPVASR